MGYNNNTTGSYQKNINNYKTWMDKQITELWDYLIDNQLATEDTLKVITSINGYNLDTLEDVLYAVTGYRSLKQIQGA